MKNQHSPRRILTFILLIMPLFTLAACSNFPFFKQKPPMPSKSVQAEQYVQAQALAALALEKNQNAKILPKSYVRNLNAHASGKKSAGTDSQISVLAMEYTLRGQSEVRTVLVPVTVTATVPSFKSLRQVQKELSSLPYTLHNLRAYYIMVAFPPSQKFSNDADLLRQQLDSEQEAMLAETTTLSSYENARLQLQLVEFFMKIHVRDAAYLALGNTKDALVSLAEDTSDGDVASLSQKTDALESQLHKEMPYKL